MQLLVSRTTLGKTLFFTFPTFVPLTARKSEWSEQARAMMCGSSGSAGRYGIAQAWIGFLDRQTTGIKR